MKKWIHPNYVEETTVNCICWNEFKIASTINWQIKLDSCDKCHKTYTGESESKVIKWRMEKFLEKQKRIEKLQKNK